MAEGLELEILQSNTKYFCHYCVREVDVLQPDLTCARCHNGFIEEVSQSSEESGSDDTDLDIEVAVPLVEYLDPSPNSNISLQGAVSLAANLYNVMRRTIRRMLLDITFGPRAEVVSQWLDREDPNSSRESEVEFDDRVLPILAEVLEEEGLGRFHQLTNLGDYALGGEWDAIITQILNEAEVTGPPPLPKEQIDAIPIITIRRAHVDKGIQCTVCMEDFKLREKVKNLPCDHFFHEECIVPWLERHATCPICRKQMNVEAESEAAPQASHRYNTRSSRNNSSESVTDSSSSHQSSSSSSPAPEASLDFNPHRFHRHRQV